MSMWTRKVVGVRTRAEVMAEVIGMDMEKEEWRHELFKAGQQTELGKGRNLRTEPEPYKYECQNEEDV